MIIAGYEFAGTKPFQHVYLTGLVRDQQRRKMSKSLGNFFTIREILDQYDPEVVRYFLTMGHYRSQIDYSEASLKDEPY